MANDCTSSWSVRAGFRDPSQFVKLSCSQHLLSYAAHILTCCPWFYLFPLLLRCCCLFFPSSPQLWSSETPILQVTSKDVKRHQWNILIYIPSTALPPLSCAWLMGMFLCRFSCTSTSTADSEKRVWVQASLWVRSVLNNNLSRSSVTLTMSKPKIQGLTIVSWFWRKILSRHMHTLAFFHRVK